MNQREISDKHIKAIRDFKAEQGISVAKWSRLSDVPETTIRSILNGKSKTISLVTAHKLASSLNTTISTMLKESSNTSNHIDMILFARCIERVEEIIMEKELPISVADRVKLYMSWYELKIYTEERSQQADKLATLARIFKQQ